MKKVFSVLTVAVLAVSTVFAGFSGEFSSDYTADFAGQNYGFANGSKLKMSFDKVLGGTENSEDAITAKLAAEFAIKDVKGEGDFLNSTLKLKEASINGANWSVDLADMAGIDNYANGIYARVWNPLKPAVDIDLNNEVKTTNGVTVDYDGWKFGVGMNFTAATPGKVEEGEFGLVGYTNLPEKLGETEIKASKNQVYYVVENETRKAEKAAELGADAAKYVFALKGEYVPVYDTMTKVTMPADAVKQIAGTFTMKQLALLDDALKIDAYVGGYMTGKKNVDLGFGAQVAFEQDKISASVASDVILNIADKTNVDADVTAKFAYDFIDASLYYATNAVGLDGYDIPRFKAKNLLDVQFGLDFASFEVPLTFDVTLLNLVNDLRGIDAAVASDFMEGASVGANFGMTFKTKAWNAGLEGSYDLKDVAKFSVGLGLKGAKDVTDVSLSVAAENTTLIENAALKLEYASENFLDKDKAAGALTASVAIEF